MNRPITTIRGRGIPLDRDDVDTDQIIPARFLKMISRTGFGEHAFAGWRSDPGFVLNDARYAGAPILLAGENFGCGSSREHAAWALQELGIAVVVAPSFADIFRTNCINIGMLPTVIPADACARARAIARENPAAEFVVDLPRQLLALAEGEPLGTFSIDPSEKDRLLRGLDPIGSSLERLAGLDDFERCRPSFLPNTLRVRP
jgi:3-isopropylmalate/(R)-2-methylmalate dehydratase small subunit